MVKMACTKVLLLSLASAAQAVSTYEPGDSCKIIGDPDVYGIGIRLGFYLQFVAAVLLVLFGQTDEIRNIRSGTNLINIAIYANVIIGTTKGTIVALDWQIVGLMTLGLGVVQWVPNTRNPSKEGFSSYAILILYMSVIGLISPYIFFTKYYEGRKEDCELYFFIFAKFSTYAKPWVTIQRISAVGGCIGAVVGLVSAFLILFWGFRREWAENDMKERIEANGGVKITINGKETRKRLSQFTLSDPDMKPIRIVWRVAQVFFCFMYLALGGLCIAFLEKTLQVNDVDLSAAPWSSSGQLIPLLVGCFSIVMAIYKGIQGLADARTRAKAKGEGESLRSKTWRPDLEMGEGEQAVLNEAAPNMRVDIPMDSKDVNVSKECDSCSVQVQEQERDAIDEETKALWKNAEGAAERSASDDFERAAAPSAQSFPLRRKGTPWA